MKGEFFEVKFKLERFDFFRFKNKLDAIFDKAGKEECYRARQINFAPLEGTTDVNIGIYALPEDYKVIKLCYSVAHFQRRKIQQIDLTRSQAMRLICTDSSVTDELPGAFPADINAYMRTQNLICGYFEEFSRVEYKSRLGDVELTYDSDFGSSRDMRGFFSKTELVPKHISMGIISIKFGREPFGIEKEIIDEVTNCGFPL